MVIRGAKMTIQLYNDDCLDFLSRERTRVDCIIADPPYIVSRPNNFTTLGTASRIGMDFGEWDKDFDVTEWMNYLPRILKENSNVVVFTDWKKLTDLVKAFEKNHITPKRCLVLAKSNPAPFNRDRMFVNDVEFAIWGVYNSKDKPTKWTFNREQPVEKCIFSTTVQSSKLHPTMKDLTVIERLVRLLTNPGDIVLDPFMGSGTTGVACKNLNRRFIGIELDKKYFETAKKRILD